MATISEFTRLLLRPRPEINKSIVHSRCDESSAEAMDPSSSDWDRVDFLSRKCTGPQGGRNATATLTVGAGRRKHASALFAAALLYTNGPTVDNGQVPNAAVDSGITLAPGQQQQLIDPVWSTGSQGPCRYVSNNDLTRTKVVPLNSQTEWKSWIAPTVAKNSSTATQFSGNPPSSTQTICCRPAPVNCQGQVWGGLGNSHLTDNTVTPDRPDYAKLNDVYNQTTVSKCSTTAVNYPIFEIKTVQDAIASGIDPMTLDHTSLTTTYIETAVWQCGTDASVSPNDGKWIPQQQTLACCTDKVFIRDMQETVTGNYLDTRLSYYDGCGNYLNSLLARDPVPSPKVQCSTN